MLIQWVDTALAKKWGKLAAFRTLHICRTGCDAKYAEPFEPETPSRKAAMLLDPVPGAKRIAADLYDVSQALSWIATARNNAEERTLRQTEIPILLNDLAQIAN